MRFAVEAWAPEYGAPTDADALAESSAEVDAWVELPVDAWAPLRAPGATAPLHDLVFVDGVRRVEANVWITDDDGVVHQGIAASFGAGAVRCNATAQLVAALNRRGLFCPAAGAEPIRTRHAHFAVHLTTSDDHDVLSLRLQKAMSDLEAEAAAEAGDAEVVVVDGPLKPGQVHAGFVGFVKTHRASYGPPLVRDVVVRLAPGERTPLLLVRGLHDRFTWYLRLPCEVRHGWAGVVRIEAPADQPLDAVTALADRLCVTLPRFASHTHKDARAPQNLYPIGGLERDLRRRLGDPALILRSLHETAAATRAAGVSDA